MKRVTWLVAVIIALVFCSTANADLSDGLVGYYPFEGNARDESGNGNHGTIFGDTALTADRFGNVNYAYLFDGDDDYIDCGDGASLDMTDAISIVVWIKPSLLNGPRILSKQDSGAGYELTMSNGNLWFILNNDIVATASLSGKENQWIFITGTWDQSAANPNVNLYVDDQAPATAYFQGPIVPPDGDDDGLFIGCRYGSYGFFTGIVDEVRIYNRALSPSEVQALYLSVPLPVADAGPDQVVVDEVSLDGSGSYKVDGGTIESWEWVLVHRTNPAFNRVASGVNPIVTDLAQGFYDVTLTVTDNSALSDTGTCLLAATGSWDLDGDGKVGNVEVIYILQVLAALRP